MKTEIQLIRFNAPIAIFGGCYSNFESTIALIASAQVISLRTEPMLKLVSNWCAMPPIMS
jgi:hypothetical protein